MTTLVALCAAVLVGAALAWGASVFAPFAFALFAIAMAAPVREGVGRRLGAGAGMLAAMLVSLVVVAALAYVAGVAFARVAAWLAANAGLLQSLVAQQMAWAEARGFQGAGALGAATEVRNLIRAAQFAAGQLQGLLSFAVVTLVFVLIGLSESGVVARQLAARGTPAARGFLAAMREAARKLRGYMLVRTAMSLLTGLCIYVYAKLTGLELAAEWGVIAFVLNYIPFLGSLIATALPTAVAALQFGSWEQAVITFVAIQGIQFVIGSWLEPIVTGKRLALSPTLTLLAVFVGALLWGIPGAFIGVPVLIAAICLCEQFPRSRFAAALLGGREPAQNEPNAVPSATTSPSDSSAPTTATTNTSA